MYDIMDLFTEERKSFCQQRGVMKLFENKKLTTICAPMVRYSKLPFRMLVRKYGCDVAFTPMIVSHSFVDSLKARHTDFSTSIEDRPLIVQFAAKNGNEFADSAELTYHYSDGVDLNCGCPQRETVEFCQRAEKAGASWISVHGRTKTQRNEAVDLDGIRIIKDSLNIPVVGNGDIFNLRDAVNFQEKTGVNGVMSARGLLQNPSLFTGTEITSACCIRDWINLSVSFGTSFTNMHHHLMFMLERVMPKHERKLFNSYTALASVVDHLNSYTALTSVVDHMNSYTQ
ncbi:tRNA-dihydrouridine(20a/20b) synthase [NAD(P)+]-like isoform X2 [Stegodyphus dumicola]|uniref:tRNA-dihydrouridine(20a/20b) synthase [NAD(P)+]-like isoform X2 n=1 Tax=Stegodyphus dumicola TaxID=202533 RepID=UPI0015B00C3A|nr:tRNA-dihydrouridine(20a/20b) synthase [NAD(P)+]-like isoform X2 [Stegodyphus dumicola]